MAAFNKSENEAVVGTGLSNASKGMPADQSLGTLFEGLGDTLKAGLNAYDESTRVKIQMAADEAVNGPNGAVAGASPDASGNLPPGAQASLGSIASLKAGLSQGTISQVQFDNGVAMHAKRIRSSVPAGYGPIVEQALSAAVGSSTANQQRQTNLAAIDEANRAESAKLGEAAKNIREFIEAENNQKYLLSASTKSYFKSMTGQDIESFIENPNEEMFGKVKLAVMYSKADETNVQSALQIAESKQKLAGVQASAVVGQVIGEVFSESSAPYQDVITAMNTAWADKKIDPEEAKNLQNLYREFKFNSASSMGTLLSKYNLSADDRKKLTDEMEVRMKGMELALSDPTFGLLNATNNYFKNRVTADGQQLVDRSKILYNIKVLTDAGVPPQVISEYYSANGGFGDLSNAIGDGASDAAAGNATVGDILKQNKEAINDPAKMAKFTQGVFSGLTNLLASENQTPEGVATVARNVFSVENENMMSLLPADQRAAMFERMVSPDVISKVIASGDADTINVVQNWATKQFKAISARAADNIIERQKYSYQLQFAFDGKQFTVGDRAVTPEEKWTDILPIEMQNLYSRKAVQGMQDINRYIRAMEPLWKADGLDTKTAIGMIMSENVNEVQKEPTILMMLRDALFSNGTDGKQSNAGAISGTAQASIPKDEKPATNAELTAKAEAKPEPKTSGKSVIAYANKGATRNLKLTNVLESSIDTAVKDVFGEGYTVQVFSGGQPKKGSGGKRTGSIRHDEGKAADIYIIGPDGKRVTDTNVLDRLVDHWEDNGLGSVGRYMRGGGIHLDEWTKDKLMAGMGSTWRY